MFGTIESTSHGDGTFTYDPNGQFEHLEEGQSATDSFSYTISDGRGEYSTGIVDIFIDGLAEPNQAPEFDEPDYSFDVDEDSAEGTYVGTVSATDPDLGDTLSYSGGSSEFNVDSSTGNITIAADAVLDFETNSSYSFDVTVTDSEGLSDTVNVTISLNDVEEPNTDPIAVNDDQEWTDYDTFITIDVLDNDSDPDGDPLSIYNFDDSATQGLVTVNTDGTLKYDPNGAFDDLQDGQTATDSFDYTISDGQGGFDTATVTITILKNIPVVWIDDVTVNEVDGVAVFVVHLRQDGEPILNGGYIEFTTTQYPDATATEDDDYEPTSGTVDFYANDSTVQIPVPIIDDSLSDGGDETFYLTITAASVFVPGGVLAAFLARQTAQATIQDDEALPVVSIADAATANEGESSIFTVTLSHAADQDVVVKYRPRNGTAALTQDYNWSGQGELTILAGQLTGTITVATETDTLSEGTEHFYVELYDSTGATLPEENDLANHRTAQGNIADMTMISIIAMDNEAHELEKDTAQFVILREGGDLSQYIPLQLLLGGTAILKDEYTLSTHFAWHYTTSVPLPRLADATEQNDLRTILLQPFQERVVITITPETMPTSDADTSVILKVLSPEIPLYRVTSNHTATANIFADDLIDDWVLVTGKIEYQGAVSYTDELLNLGNLPLRGAKIEIWDANGDNTGMSDVKLDETFTDENGEYAIRVPGIETGGWLDFGNADIYIKIVAQSRDKQEVKIAYTVGFKPADPVVVSLRDQQTQNNVALGSTVTANRVIRDVPITMPGKLGESMNHAAFAVFDAMYTYARYHATLPDVAPQDVTIIVTRGDADRSQTAYNSSTEIITIHEEHRHAWDTIGHEYGHMVHHGQGVNIVGAAHDPAYNLRTDIPSKALVVAFAEGWATYFSEVAQMQSPAPPLRAAGYADGKFSYVVYLSRSVAYDLEHETLTKFGNQGNRIARSLGEDNEASVFRILWDLYDPADVDDALHYGELAVWRLVMSSSPKLSEIVAKLNDQASSNQERFALGRTLEDHYVVSAPLSVRVDGHVTTEVSTEDLPSFDVRVPYGVDWKFEDLGTVSVRLKLDFTIQFYTNTGSQLIVDIPAVLVPSIPTELALNPPPEGFIVTFTPTAEVWQSIVAAAVVEPESSVQIYWSVADTDVDFETKFKSGIRSITIVSP